MSEKFTPSSGNVFRDLGFDAVEAEDLRLRAELLSQLADWIRAMGKPQSAIAQRLGISQPRVSNLLQGRLHLFSLESLILMLNLVGQKVDVTVRSIQSEPRALADHASAGASQVYVTGGAAGYIASTTDAVDIAATGGERGSIDSSFYNQYAHAA